MSRIRLRYAGLVSVSAKVFGLLTGLAFTTMVTRRLTPSDFGAWQVITALFTYYTLPQAVVSYWLTREIARGAAVGRTGLALALSLSIPATLLFTASSFPVSSSIGYAATPFLLAALQIPVFYAYAALESIANGSRPQLVGYASMAFEASKVLFAAVLVALGRLSLEAAIATVAMAYLVEALLLAALQTPHLRGSLQAGAARRWLGVAWLPVYVALAPQLPLLDSLILTYATGSTIPAAYLRAVQTFSSIVTFSVLAASPLYPKLLAGGGPRDAETALKMLIIFAAPSATGAILLPRPLLGILRPDYMAAEWALRVGALAMLFASLSSFAEIVLSGTETVDTAEGVSPRGYLRSRLALIPLLSTLQNILYLILLYPAARLLQGAAPEAFAIAASSTSLAAALPLTAYRWARARRALTFKVSAARLRGTVLASLAMAAVIAAQPSSLSGAERFAEDISAVARLIISGGATYLVTLVALDGEVRSMARQAAARLRSPGRRTLEP